MAAEHCLLSVNFIRTAQPRCVRAVKKDLTDLCVEQRWYRGVDHKPTDIEKHKSTFDSLWN